MTIPGIALCFLGSFYFPFSPYNCLYRAAYVRDMWNDLWHRFSTLLYFPLFPYCQYCAAYVRDMWNGLWHRFSTGRHWMGWVWVGFGLVLGWVRVGPIVTGDYVVAGVAYSRIRTRARYCWQYLTKGRVFIYFLHFYTFYFTYFTLLLYISSYTILLDQLTNCVNASFSESMNINSLMLRFSFVSLTWNCRYMSSLSLFVPLGFVGSIQILLRLYNGT